MEYLDYTIDLDFQKTFIKIKIINKIANYFCEKNITQNDLDTLTLDKYYSLLLSAISKKLNCIIEFIEHVENIDLVLKYESEFIDITETINFDKINNDDIKIIKNKINELSKEIIELKNSNDGLKIIKNKLMEDISKLYKENSDCKMEYQKILERIDKLEYKCFPTPLYYDQPSTACFAQQAPPASSDL